MSVDHEVQHDVNFQDVSILIKWGHFSRHNDEKRQKTEEKHLQLFSTYSIYYIYLITSQNRDFTSAFYEQKM